MPGIPITTSFSETKTAQIDTVIKRLHLTRQQFIRQAVDEYMLKLDPFTMAGGKRVDRTR